MPAADTDRRSGDHAGRSALAAGQEAGAALPLLVRLDTEFHLALYRLSGNPGFEEIAAAVMAGDAEGAERAASAHAFGAGRAAEQRMGGVAEAA